VKPPLWLVLATAAMAIVLLVMSVTETSFKGQYLIDQGEWLSLAGLVFILIAGLYLHRRGQLAASMPLVLPWLLYPVITQGDQIIDNLSITWMRIIVHILLALIFAAPVAVIVYAARWAGVSNRRTLFVVTIALLAAELWLAWQFLGWLMIGTQLAMILMVIVMEARAPRAAQRHARRAALATLVIGVVISGGLYLAFKNRPGAYQGSPSYYMDPSQPGSGFQSSVAIPAGAIAVPENANEVRSVLNTYARVLELLLDGYYILDRNYNYHFHNELFLRSTPLLAHYRQAGLDKVAEAATYRAVADVAADGLALGHADPLQALVADVRDYVAFNFARAATLERLSAEFETTKAGLQHATHIYEGEGKYLGVQLAALLDRHRAVLTAPALRAIVGEFDASARAIHDRYANRIVGF
jgi:hypothetical protein